MSLIPEAFVARVGTAVSEWKKSELVQRLSAGILWMTAAAIAGKGLSLVSSITLARVLGRASLGEFGMVFNTVTMFETFASFGLGGAATKYIAQYRGNHPSDAASVVRLTVLSGVVIAASLSLVLLLSAPLLAAKALAAPHLTGLVRISSIALFFVALDGIQIGIISGLESFRSIALVTFVQGCVYVVFVVVGTLAGGLIGAVWGLCASTVVKCIINGAALRVNAEYARIMGSGASSQSHLSILWKYSLPMVLNGILVTPVAWGCNAILANQKDGYGQLGILSAAVSWQTVVMFLSSSISRTTLPILSDLYGRKEFGAFRRVLRVKVMLTGGVSALVAVPIIVLSRYVMAAYGAEFVPGYPVLIVICVTGVITSMLAPMGLAIQSLGHLWFGLVLNLSWATVAISVCLLLAPFLGALGLALAIVTAYICLLVMCVLFLVVRVRKLCS